jgi:hypothetical protein
MLIALIKGSRPGRLKSNQGEAIAIRMDVPTLMKFKVVRLATLLVGSSFSAMRESASGACRISLTKTGISDCR